MSHFLQELEDQAEDVLEHVTEQYKGVRMITIYDNDLPGNGAGEKDWV